MYDRLLHRRVARDTACLRWLERHLHPKGLQCPRCGTCERLLAQRPAPFPACRCRQCVRLYTVLTGTDFAKTRQTPAKLVLILRGIAQGETTARLARELGLFYKQMHTLRQRAQGNLYERLPNEPMTGTQFEADELYQKCGERRDEHRHLADPPRCRANKVRDHGTYANDWPPIFSIVGRTTGEVRYFVEETADGATCQGVIRSSVPRERTVLYTDEWGGSWSVEKQMKLSHGSVKHSEKEWAQDDDADGQQELHCNRCQGTGAELRTCLRVFRGVHKYSVADYVSTYETMLNAKRITPVVVQWMYRSIPDTHSRYR
jgi:hypothetical protein